MTIDKVANTSSLTTFSNLQLHFPKTRRHQNIQENYVPTIPRRHMPNHAKHARARTQPLRFPSVFSTVLYHLNYLTATYITLTLSQI